MWKWSENQRQNIDTWKSQQLRDVYFAIFRKFVTENFVKRDLRNFGGLQYTKQQKVEHAKAIADELGVNALIRVCTFLQIDAGFDNIEDLASKITDAISFDVEKTGSRESLVQTVKKQSARNDEELAILEQIQNVDEENAKLRTEIYNKEKSVIELQQQIQTLENSDDEAGKANVEKLNYEAKMAALEVKALQAQADALVSKKETLNAKAKLTRISLSSSSDKSSSKSNRVKDWLDLQSVMDPPDNDLTETALQSTITQMLARQTFNSKQIEFDGTSALAWRHFLAEFNRTSKECGYSNEENVQRLSKNLKGAAREKVEILLISAKSPDKILSILDSIYGGVENVALEVMEKAQNIERVNELADFQKFNCAVQNLNAALDFIEWKLVDTQKLLAMMIGKLDEAYLREWGSFLNKKGIRATASDFDLFAEWTQNQANLMQDICFFKKVRDANAYGGEQAKDDNKAEKKVKISSCQLCGGEKHSFDKCSEFIKADTKKKWDYASKHNACFCCLKFHKGACSQRNMCKINNCDKYHHRLLHKTKPSVVTNTTTTTTSAANVPQTFTGCTQEVTESVLLKMVPVTVHGPNCSKEIVAFLDDGSTVTMMDLSIAREVGLQTKKQPFCFNWTGGVFRYEPEAELASFSISGNNENTFELKDVRLIENLSLPAQQINYNELKEQAPYAEMANLQNLENSQPMLLIGQKHANLITTRAVINVNDDGPILSKTKLGWVLHGPVNIKAATANFACCQSSDENLNEIIKQHFSLENFGACLSKIDKTKSVEDQLALQKLQNSICKVNGRYQVKLPWRKNEVVLPDSRPMAEQRLRCLERKLIRDSEMATAYQREIEKLLESGYAQKANDDSVLQSNKLWYLPHFAVINPNKPGKVRVVFDAAAECNGTSLNKQLFTGPDWTASIIGILIRFRMHRIAFVGDIKEMFNQIKIDADDAAAQCFLWRNLDLDAELCVYQMGSMLFGTNSSPFIAQFVKNFNADSFKEIYPKAANAIVADHYVDDYLGGEDNVDDAVNLINTVIKIHKAGGFDIRRFVSNNKNVLERLSPEVCSNDMVAKMGENQNIQKVLGIIWDANEDVFKFSKNTMHKISCELLSGEKAPTKRKVLAAVNSVYDPLGFVTPVTINGRLLMRDIWAEGLHWDDEIDGELKTKWQLWLKGLQAIENLKIPRWYFQNVSSAHRIELHIFNDASSQAYASAIYLRSCYRIGDEERYETALVISKARVSPIKQITIPKLETLAAVMGCRLAMLVANELKIKVDQRYFWTDSRTVLNWIHSNKKLQTFEANRIGEICEITSKSEWNWVPTASNIADIATRQNSSFDKFERWFCGPEFLKQDKSSWPKQPEFTNKNEITMLIVDAENPLRFLAEKTSRFKTLIRITAYVNRFIYNVSRKRREKSAVSNDTLSGTLSAAEIEAAENIWYKILQSECYSHEIAFLRGKHVPPKMRLTKYEAYLDDNGIMRISGRIERAIDVPVTTRNPIVLDGKHPFTQLLIQHMHEKVNHVGTQTLVHQFKTAYWMPRMTTQIRRILLRCGWCRKQKAKPTQPKMGILPKERFLTFQKPFSATGIDYFGPFYVRTGRGEGGRYSKAFRTRYGVLFTCMTTRAIHVEIAHSLNTDSCIMAIRRMMARRGKINTILSDNATNFRGAAVELVQALEELDETSLESRLASEGVTWKFIPANAPNFGGTWERLIGCFKRAIHAVISVDRNPTDEMLQTIFCEAEHLVNSRPYVIESDDPTDDIGLCPNEILSLQRDAIYVPGKFSDYDSDHKRLWRVSQLLVDNFWKRFLKEYIPTLINRGKWHNNAENIREGEIVIVRENNTPRGDWPLGVITKVYPGEDNIVRVVDVRTTRNTYRRPVNRICRLKINRIDEDDRAEETRTQH